MFYKKEKNQNELLGFTLIEVLVVVLIISILSGLVLGVVNSSGVRAKARDAQRKTALKQIQTGLELYFADNRRYPASGVGGSAWQRISDSNPTGWMEDLLISGGYMGSIPLDPTQSGTDTNPCSNPTNYRYNYRTDASGTIYALTSIMEVVTSNDDSTCASLNNWTTLSVCANFLATDYCYGVENP